jgi:hypothetical protein
VSRRQSQSFRLLGSFQSSSVSNRSSNRFRNASTKSAKSRGRRGGERDCRQRGRREPHRKSAGRWNGAAPGRRPFASVSNHCSRMPA